MAEKVSAIIGGPSRFDLAVSLAYETYNREPVAVLFKLRKPWNSHSRGDEMEVYITMLRYKRPWVDEWEFEGYRLSASTEIPVSGRYSTIQRGGTLKY